MGVEVLLDNLSSITEALRRVQGGTALRQWIVPLTPSADPGLLEAVLFLKPGATDLAHGVRVERALVLIAGQLKAWDMAVDALVVLGAEYLHKFDIILDHYGVITRISMEGRAGISDDAERALSECFGKELAQGAVVLGGHQFRERYPGLTPWALKVLVDNVETIKLAPGTYCARVRMEDGAFLVLNGFHPYQVEHFTQPEQAIVVLVVRGQGSWKAYRSELVGATNPAKALPGSLRREFLERRSELGIGHIDQGNNAVHLSAGPLEGMVEMARFLSDHVTGCLVGPAQTCFGQLLFRAGLDESRVAWLMTNPQLVVDGRCMSAFDLTEETQPPAAVELLEGNLG